MKFRNLILQTRIWSFFALSALTITFISSCQKDSATNPVTTDTMLQSAAKSNTLNTLAATSTSTLKTIYKVSGPIALNGAHDLTIKGDSINGGSVPCISLSNCYNIHISHCKLINSTTVGINLYNCVNVIVDSSFVGNVSTGVYAVGSKSIQINYNQMRNMRGPFPKGAFVQFDNVNGGGNRITSNKFENIMGQSYPEDAISMYKSNGLPTDPIRIVGNWIRGGGPSKTGGGIMLGDNGGSYQTAQNNTLVNPGQYGMAVSGGTNMQVLNNTIYGASSSFSNVGLYYWNQSKLPSSAITMSGNKVNFTSGAWGVNNCFIGQGCATPTGWNTNTWSANIRAAILPATFITL
jgi:hypothetical protein